MRFTIAVSGGSLFVTVPYNIYAKRYYVKVTDGSNRVVTYAPMVGSPDGYDINLILPYAPRSLVYRESSNNFEVN